jgi:predicted Zn-dependent peptidase
MYESAEECGITHFFEHIAIRNVNECMGGELYKLLDAHGLEFNASTFSEMVQFYISGAAKNVRLGAEVLTKLLSPIVLSVKDVNTERKRIKAEIRESDDKNSLADFTNKIVFENTSLSGSIVGTNSSVDKITRERLENYRKRIFTKENVLFYLTGNYTEEDLAFLGELADSYGIPSGEGRDNFAPIPEKFGKRDADVYVKSADFTMVRFSFDLDMKKVSVPETDLLYDILLSGYNSKLFIEMSEKRGLFYDTSGAVERYKNIGNFYFSFEVKEKDIYEATELVVNLLHEMKNTAIPEGECMQAGYVDNAYMLYDDSRELNFTFAYDNHVMELGYGSLEDRRRAYAAVTAEDLMRAAKEIFRKENLILTVKGNKKRIDTARLKEILKTI